MKKKKGPHTSSAGNTVGYALLVAELGELPVCPGHTPLCASSYVPLVLAGRMLQLPPLGDTRP